MVEDSEALVVGPHRMKFHNLLEAQSWALNSRCPPRCDALKYPNSGNPVFELKRTPSGHGFEGLDPGDGSHLEYGWSKTEGSQRGAFKNLEKMLFSLSDSGRIYFKKFPSFQN
jgi:hypothetical protein